MTQSTFEKELKIAFDGTITGTIIKPIIPFPRKQELNEKIKLNEPVVPLAIVLSARDIAMEGFEKDIDDLNSFLKKGLPFDAIKVLVKKHFGGKQ